MGDRFWPVGWEHLHPASAQAPNHVHRPTAASSCNSRRSLDDEAGTRQVVLQSGRMSFGGKAIVAVVIATVAIVGVPMYAADPGSVAGQALSAVGEPLEGATVELFKAAAGRPTGGVVQAVTAGPDGAWQFLRVVPGDYVVQMSVGEQFVAVPVSLAVDAGVAGVQLVAPSVAAAAGTAAGAGAAGAGGAAAGGAAAGGVLGTNIAIGAAVAGAAAATAAVVVTDDES